MECRLAFQLQKSEPWNAKKHGILGALRTDYEDNVHDGYIRQLYDEYQPVRFIERLLVERIEDLFVLDGGLGRNRYFLFHFTVSFKKNEYTRLIDSRNRRISEVCLEEEMPFARAKVDTTALVARGSG